MVTTVSINANSRMSSIPYTLVYMIHSGFKYGFHFWNFTVLYMAVCEEAYCLHILASVVTKD